MSEALRLLAAVLTTFRLARLVSSEEGPLFVFNRLRDYTDRQRADEQQHTGSRRGPWAALDEGLRCPYCTGVWFAALCVVLVRRPTRKGDLFLTWWGLAGAQSFLQELIDV